MAKKMYLYDYDKEWNDWELRTIIHFDEFDDDGIEKSSIGLVKNTGHNEFPRQKYLATIFKGKNMKITISDDSSLEEETIYENKEVK